MKQLRGSKKILQAAKSTDDIMGALLMSSELPDDVGMKWNEAIDKRRPAEKQPYEIIRTSSLWIHFCQGCDEGISSNNFESGPGSSPIKNSAGLHLSGPTCDCDRK